MQIKKQIPVSAALQNFREDESVRFICYGLAKMMNAEFNFTHDDRAWACYAELERKFGISTFSNQINRQLWQFLVKLGFQNEHVTFYGFDFVNFYIHTAGRTKYNVTFEDGMREFRIQIMEFILALDPNAVFDIDLNSKYD
jgi:hypothetical protein